MVHGTRRANFGQKLDREGFEYAETENEIRRHVRKKCSVRKSVFGRTVRLRVRRFRLRATRYGGQAARQPSRMGHSLWKAGD